MFVVVTILPLMNSPFRVFSLIHIFNHRYFIVLKCFLHEISFQIIDSEFNFFFKGGGYKTYYKTKFYEHPMNMYGKKKDF